MLVLKKLRGEGWACRWPLLPFNLVCRSIPPYWEDHIQIISSLLSCLMKCFDSVAAQGTNGIDVRVCSWLKLRLGWSTLHPPVPQLSDPLHTWACTVHPALTRLKVNTLKVHALYFRIWIKAPCSTLNEPWKPIQYNSACIHLYTFNTKVLNISV